MNIVWGDESREPMQAEEGEGAPGGGVVVILDKFSSPHFLRWINLSFFVCFQG